MRARFLRLLLVLALAGALVPLAAAPAAAVVAPAPIVVNTLLDAVGDDGACSLHEAIEAANTNAASGAAAGECAAGSSTSADRITFTVAGTITMTTSMPDLLTSMTIDGGGSITVDADGVDTVLSTAAPAIVTLKGLTLTGGDGNAGAIGNNANLTLSHVTLIANHAILGGGVYNATGATLTVADSTITANSASEAGGGILLQPGSTASVARTTISDNAAVGSGGGISTRWSASYGSATATISQSTISGNSASFGGGVSTGGTVSLRNSTVAENTASSGGGGAHVTRTLSVIASTIALNSSPSGAGILIDGGAVTTLTNGLIIGNTPGGEWVGSSLSMAVNSLVGVPDGQVLADTLAGGLAANGGPTKTVRLARNAANLALNRGKSTACAASPISGVDQRGVGRPTVCDVGAFELDTSAPTVTLQNPFYLRSQVPADGKAWARTGWTGSDGTKGSGIVSYDVSRSVNGGAWTTISPGQAGNAHDQTITSGATYRFRIRARDRDGNLGSWKAGPSFTARLVNETSSAFRYAGSWSRAPLTGALGGYVKGASRAGASATFTFTGRAVGLVTSVGPARGRAKVYVNGTYVTTIDLKSLVSQPRVLLWTRAWSTSVTRTVKVVVIGTAGRPRVDIDAFVVMR